MVARKVEKADRKEDFVGVECATFSLDSSEQQDLDIVLEVKYREKEVFRTCETNFAKIMG